MIDGLGRRDAACQMSLTRQLVDGHHHTHLVSIRIRQPRSMWYAIFITRSG